MRIDYREGPGVLVAEPEGRIAAADIERLSQEIESRAAQAGRPPGLVIRTDRLPGWEGFEAFREHLGFIREKQAELPRVAFVSGADSLSLLPEVARHFVKARVRRFAPDALEEAVDWAAGSQQETEGLEVLSGFPDDVIAVRAVGEVTARDYEDLLEPAVAERARRHGKVRLFFEVPPAFEGYTVAALWDDTRLGLLHLRDFERVAVVTDIGWVRSAARLFAPLVAGDVMIFAEGERKVAEDWIAA